QLCGHRREHPEDRRRPAEGARAVAVYVPAVRQHPAADPRLLPRGNHHPAGDRARPAADRGRAGHRSRSFRRGGRGQHHDRPGDAAVRPAALPDGQDRGSEPDRAGARSDAVPVGDDRRARAADLHSGNRPVPAAPVRLQGLDVLGKAAIAMWWDVPREAQPEWEEWHTVEHMPERLSIPGFLRGSRWISGESSYFVLYEAAELAAITSGPYL